MTDSRDDRALVGALLARKEERAFEALYDRHTPVLYALALRLSGGDEPEACEAVHDAWVRAVDNLARFEWRASLRTWLCSIVINCAREIAHRQGRDAGPPLEEMTLASDDARLEGIYDRVDLERAIAGLPPGYRRVFVLHDVEGYKHEEIATLLGISCGTSKSQLSGARAALRRALRQTEGVHE